MLYAFVHVVLCVSAAIIFGFVIWLTRQMLSAAPAPHNPVPDPPAAAGGPDRGRAS
jgi:hypothetical protein